MWKGAGDEFTGRGANPRAADGVKQGLGAAPLIDDSIGGYILRKLDVCPFSRFVPRNLAMKKKLVVAAIAGVSVAALALMQTFVWAQEAAAEPKYTIKEVMGQAHKDGLLQKVVDGDATPEEKALLLDLYLSLLENNPPQGDADAFHAKAGEAVVAAARAWSSAAKAPKRRSSERSTAPPATRTTSRRRSEPYTTLPAS